MGERGSILVISPDAGRRDRARAALAETAEVQCAEDLPSALESVSIGGFTVALVDAALPGDGVKDVLSALGAPGRAAVWTDAADPELLEYGAYVQVPYGASDRSLAGALDWLVRTAAEPAGSEDDARAELEGVLDVVAHVRHELNNPLTAILAEVQLQLMDRDQLSEDTASSLEGIETQAQRMRDLVKDLRGLKR